MTFEGTKDTAYIAPPRGLTLLGGKFSFCTQYTPYYQESVDSFKDRARLVIP